MKTGMKALFGAVAVAGAMGIGSTAQALPVRSFTFNFTDAAAAEGYAGATIVDRTNVNSVTFGSALAFTAFQLQNPGTFTPGDKFIEFVAVRVDSFKSPGGATLSVPGYGSEQELTIIGAWSGTVLTGTPASSTAKVESLHMFDVYYDAGQILGADGSLVNTLSIADDLATASNLSTWTDGTNVEDGTALSNASPNTASANGNFTVSGTLNLGVVLDDEIAGLDFEQDHRDINGDLIDLSIFTIEIGLVNTDNTFEQPGVNLTAAEIQNVADAMGASLGFDPGTIDNDGVFTGITINGESYTAGFVVRSDGSLIKNVASGIIPEPITAGLGLLSLGALGLAATRRRTA